MRVLLVVGVTTALLVPAASAGAADDPGSGLVSYTLSANAPGLAIEGLYKDVALTVPETSSSLSTGGVGTGFAAIAWPGPIVGNLGTSILVLEGSAPAGVTVLNDPVRAESHSSGSTQSAKNTTLPGTVMQSTATQSRVTASSATGPATTLPIGTVGVISGSSSTVLKGATGAVATSTSRVAGISLAGGLISVGAVESTATTATTGTSSTATGSTHVTGLTIAGIPVEIDGSGLTVAGTSIKNPLAAGTLNSAIKSLGLTVLLTQPTITKTVGAASYSAGALVLMYSQGANDYALTLGRASASVAVGKGFVQPFVTTPVPPTVTVPGTTSPGLGAGTTTEPLTSVPSVDAPSTIGLLAPTTVAPAATSSSFLPRALTSLAGGAPAALLLPLLLLVGLLGTLLFRLPEPLLNVLGSDACEEQQG